MTGSESRVSGRGAEFAANERQCEADEWRAGTACAHEARTACRECHRKGAARAAFGTGDGPGLA